MLNLQTQVKRLTKQVEQLSDKCVDLEGRSKRQNIRIAGVKEGNEHGQRLKDFVAQLLQKTLGLETTPLLDRAHRALRECPGDDKPVCLRLGKILIICCHGRFVINYYWLKNTPPYFMYM